MNEDIYIFVGRVFSVSFSLLFFIKVHEQTNKQVDLHTSLPINGTTNYICEIFIVDLKKKEVLWCLFKHEFCKEVCKQHCNNLRFVKTTNRFAAMHINALKNQQRPVYETKQQCNTIQKQRPARVNYFLSTPLMRVYEIPTGEFRAQSERS